MTEEILSIGSPVQEFVSSFLEQVSNGIEAQGFAFCKQEESHAEMELNAVETTKAEGGIKIHIFSAGGKLEDTNSQKMKVYVKKPTEVDEAEEKARIKKAEVEETHATPLAFERAQSGKD